MLVRRMLTGALAVTAAGASLLIAAVPAAASPTDDAVAVLNHDSLYIAPDLGAIKVSSPDAARAALQGTNVKVAVFKQGTGNPPVLAHDIGSRLTDNKVTVGVFAGTAYGAGSSILGSGCAAVAMQRAVSQNLAELQSTHDLTTTIETFAKLASSAPTNGSCSPNSGASVGGSASGTATKSGSSGTGGWTILGVFGLLGAGAVGALVWRRKRKDKRALADARAEIQPYYDRLANEVNTLYPGDNAIAKQALSDASERFNSAGSQMAAATSLAQLGGARRSVLEGLQAARTARTALGLDPGPDIPPLVQTNAPQLTGAQQFDVNGQAVVGYPQYQPGAPYYFAGGGGYAGGWYSTPFWQTLLIAEALSPGWGWGFGGWGGYGGGYDSGYDSGYDAGRDAATDQSGGDGNSGGDWGGGGGDWGGGGGDWGGGGGDWGGGGGGGGDW